MRPPAALCMQQTFYHFLLIRPNEAKTFDGVGYLCFPNGSSLSVRGFGRLPQEVITQQFARRKAYIDIRVLAHSEQAEKSF